jgi:spoIIIJ-associated protein
MASLQYLINLIVSRRYRDNAPFCVDVEGYRQRREKALQDLAFRMAERVRTTGRTVTLEPMPPNERRIVHLALAKDPTVSTSSVGDGESRKVAIMVLR